MDDDETRFRVREDAGAGAESIRIPGVTLRGVLGRGGMAVVYEGEDLGFSPPRRVAVKLMDPTLSGDPDFRTRFEREASLVADFRHDNIVHIYSSGDVRGAKYIVMEYLPGGTLAQRLEAGPLPAREAVPIAVTLAGALAYSHARGVIHRDFKPGNVLFTVDGRAVLSDFGVAKVLSDGAVNLTQYAAVVGAPRYMSPEQERGEEVTDRTDIFSFGVTLFEMLTGKLPPARVRGHRGKVDDADLRSFPSGMSPTVVDLVVRALALDPSDRPSARECEAILGSIDLDGADPTAEAEERSATGSNLPRFRRYWVIGGATIVVALLGLLGLPGLFKRPTGSTISPMPVPAATPVPAAPARIPISFLKSPASERIWIDGSPLQADTAAVAPGRHTLIAIAPGYYGEFRPLEVPPHPPGPIEVRLTPVQLPGTTDYDRFLDLADRPHLTSAEVDGIPESTFRNALQPKLLRDQGQGPAAAEFEARTAQLARLGDARASVVTLLVAAARDGRISKQLATPELAAASAGGDALATFFRGLTFRDAVHRNARGEVSATDPDFNAYCSLMSLARQQGLAELAGRALQHDDCPAKAASASPDRLGAT